MATVYLARQESLGREVALKLLEAAGGADAAVAGERFLREARIAASLHHPHIVPIYDFGVHDGTAYLAMEYEPGGTIAPMTGEKLAPRDALRIVREIAGALDYAHGHGIVHRDIKPDNILRRADGAATLSDFGIARLVQGESVLTTEGTSVGTPQYMSPEQLRGEKVDGRSDLYSLGIVLWQLLTGEPPYTGNDSWAIGTQHINAPVPRLPEGLAHLQALVDALLAKQPDARLESGAELTRRIDALLAGAPTPPTSPATVATDIHAATGIEPTAARPAARRRSRQLAMAAVACVALGLMGWLAWQQFGVRGSAARVAPNRVVVASAALGPLPGSVIASLPAADKSIAVLPFVNMSADPEQTYFSDGLSEDLITALSQSGELRVIARDFSFRFRGQAGDSRAIATQLGVAHLLSGSVRRAGDVVRISANLINAADGSTLWSQHFDRPYRDLFKLQDEITAEVATALKARMLGDPRSPVQGDRPASGNLAAFTSFLRGRFHYQRATLEGMRTAIADFDRAIALDPGYAQAYAARAYVRADLTAAYVVGDEGPPVEFARARADAMRALELAPGLGSAHLALGLIAQTSDIDSRAAESEFRKAVKSAPGDPRALVGLALTLAGLGQYDGAAAAGREALRLDPLNAETYVRLASVDLGHDKLDEAERALRRAIVLQPDGAFIHIFLSAISIRRGDAAAAMREASREPPGIWHDYATTMAAQIGSDRATADGMLAKFSAAHANEAAFQIAEMYALRKQPDPMLEWLVRARKQRDPGVGALFLSPSLMDYRRDPRLIAFTESVGLPRPARTEAEVTR